MGWLHSRPKVGNDDAKPKSRLDKLSKDDPLRGCPDCDPYIVAALQKCGIVSHAGMGLSPLTWQELQAFCAMTKTPLTGWEAEQVIMMSREYVSSRNLYDKEPAFPSPWRPELTDEQWAARAQAIQNAVDKKTR